MINLTLVVERIQYKHWEFRVKTTNTVPYLQIHADAPCNDTGVGYKLTSRKWMLSPHMTEGEVVQTALKAVLTAVEHEAREKFRYKGVALFQPHLPIAVMMERASEEERRTEGTTT